MRNHVLLLMLVIANGQASPEKMSEQEEPKGIIGEIYIDDLPVIYSFVDEEPAEAKRKALPWLAVVSWSYDGSKNNGMPPKKVNERMIALEDALEAGVEEVDECEHTISRTGGNLKELIYYIRDREKFIKALNAALAKHDRYPIDIKFYHDPEWKELNELRAEFKQDGEQAGAGQSTTPSAPGSEGVEKSEPEPESESESEPEGGTR